MPNLIKEFKSFYLRIVLPNVPSYSQWFNVQNFDFNIRRLLDEYKTAFGQDPFEVDSYEKSINEIKENLKVTNNSFRDYSKAIGNDVPLALLNSHCTCFLLYYGKEVRFKQLQDLINNINGTINIVGHKKDFIRSFREFRSRMNGKQIRNGELLFSKCRDDFWSINVGAEQEVQYHVSKEDPFISYGLGFNLHGSRNNRNPLEQVIPFKNAFYAKRKEIDDILQDFHFYRNDEDNLKNLVYNTFVLYGKKIPFVKLDDKNFSIKGLDFLELLYDLKYKQFKVYKNIFETSKMNSDQINTVMNIEKVIELLLFKKQIILQGPPGTGKTKFAKEIAKDLIEVSDELFTKIIYKNLKINSLDDLTTYTVTEVNLTNLEIVNNQSFEKHSLNIEIIKNSYSRKSWLNNNIDQSHKIIMMIAHYIYDNILSISDQFNLLQFHPSYSYEDFVRGIEANSVGSSIEYRNVNKILGKIINKANENYLDTRIYRNSTKETTSFRNKLDLFKAKVREYLDKIGDSYPLSGLTAAIFEITDTGFLYKFPNKPNVNNNIIFSDLIKLNELGENYNTANDIHLQEAHLKMKSKSTYYYQVYKAINDLDDDDVVEHNPSVKLKNYVIVIDEINRANLSSVLGELIYALEYRGEEVDSMYEVDGSNKISLPPNLYIIGTMNTADRSVGHIDYAIRRRFAFVDLLPKNLQKEAQIKFDLDLFIKVSKLFVGNYDFNIDYYEQPEKIEKSNYLSPEFRPEEVWLGHSYFIDKVGATMEMRLQYEIKPILLEYIKDGVLQEDARKVIMALPNDFSTN